MSNVAQSIKLEGIFSLEKCATMLEVAVERSPIGQAARSIIKEKLCLFKLHQTISHPQALKTAATMTSTTKKIARCALRANSTLKKK